MSEEPEIVAWKSRWLLYCLDCDEGLGEILQLTAMTSEDLPDGGLCSICHGDVLA